MAGTDWPTSSQDELIETASDLEMAQLKGPGFKLPTKLPGLLNLKSQSPIELIRRDNAISNERLSQKLVIKESWDLP